MGIRQIRGVANKEIRWLAELEDAHKGEIGFLLGNGWSINFYDIGKLKGRGILIGCNDGHKTDPVDYLIWQDSNVAKDCCAAKDCIKIAPFKMSRRGNYPIDPSTTYFYNTGGMKGGSCLPRGNTGFKAFGLARILGFSVLILVGCDCRVFYNNKTGTYHSNRFQDKQASRILRKSGGKRRNIPDSKKVKNGWMTTTLLQTFADMFGKAYSEHKEHMEIFHLGDFAIHSVPAIDFPELWSCAHPGKEENHGIYS